MADTDYTIRGNGGFASVATMSVGVGPLDTIIPISGIQTANGDSRRVGEGVMFGTKEIGRLVAVASDHLVIARGCADTIPQSHGAGTALWFYEDAIGAEDSPNDRAAGTTVGVKLLPTTVGGGQLAISASPPNALTFDYRFARPYPPGNFKINGNPWFAYLHINAMVSEAVLTWAHRDRLLQADQLVEHEAIDVGPEPGTTYVVRVYNASNVLKREAAGITGTTWTYTKAMAQADLGDEPSTPGYITLHSVRDGLTSRQRYRADFTLTAIAGVGYGFNFSNNWGGNP